MSTAYLLLLFLCISLHACNARHLMSPLDKKLEKIKKPHFSVKGYVDERNGFDPSPKKLNEGDRNKMKTRVVVDDSEKSKKIRRNHQRVLNKAMGKGASSGALQAESLVSVSWRVPHHKKRSHEKHIPGFNLDYSPPKTHPPSHN